MSISGELSRNQILRLVQATLGDGDVDQITRVIDEIGILREGQALRHSHKRQALTVVAFLSRLFQEETPGSTNKLPLFLTMLI